MNSRWRVVPGQSLHYRAWDEEAVVYNDLSGDTHLLGAAALEILLALKDGALGRRALAQALCMDGQGADPQLEDGIAELLASLAALSLVEQITC